MSTNFETSPDNNTFITDMLNITQNFTIDDEYASTLYKTYIPLLILFCLISIIVNIRVLLSVHWIKNPLSPTLHISLSLAAADACTSALICAGLLINSYLPIVYTIDLPCYILISLELFRLSGIIITVIHLLALSIHHWLGIIKPLHYTTIVTSKKVLAATITLWLLPILFFHTYFILSSENNDWFPTNCNNSTIFDRYKFRLMFSLLFFIPLILMICCYAHILHIVRKQQRIWAKLSRSGSQRSRGLNKSNTQQRRTMETNVKAVYTTLLILGSCMIGWMPANIVYLLVCEDGCMYKVGDIVKDTTFNFFIAWLTNMLVILKTLANPIIYSARMIEIKEGMRRMKLALGRTFCKTRRENYVSNLEPLHLGYSGSTNIGVTALCKLNGNLTTRRSIRLNYPNTLV